MMNQRNVERSSIIEVTEAHFTDEECQRALDWPLRRGLAVAGDIPLGPDTLIRAIDYP